MAIDRTDYVYNATRAALLAVRKHNLQSDRPIEVVAMPGLGTGYGQVSNGEAARQMALAFKTVSESTGDLVYLRIGGMSAPGGE